MVARLAGFSALLATPVHAGYHVWTGSAPRAKSIEAIARDPLNTQRMWAATFGAGVYRSLDGGATWTGYRNGLTNTFVRCLAVNPNHPDSVFCGTNDGVYSSVDGGVNWNRVLSTTVQSTSKSVRGLSLHPIRTAVVYASVYGLGVYKTVDGGRTWGTRNMGLTTTTVRDVAIHPANPETLLAATGTGGGVFRSNNGGLSWSQVPDPTVIDGAAEQIVFDRLDPQRVYVAELERGVLKSADGGTTWSRINTGLPNLRTRSLAVVDSLRYVGTDGSGVFFSRLDDPIWHPASAGLTSPIVDALFSSPSAPSKVWAGTDGGGIFRSDDRGGGWTQLDGGLLDTFGFSLAVRPETHVVYAGLGFGDQFWRSADQATTWSRTSFILTHDSERGVAVDPVSPQTVFLSAYGAGVLRSDDDGVTWFKPDSLSGGNALANPFVRPLVARPNRTGHLYVGTGDGVHESVDGGVQWIPRNTGLPASLSIRSLAVSPSQPETLYAGSDVAGVFRSLDGGVSWVGKSVGLANLFVHSLAVDASLPSTVYAGTDSGVFKSTDYGNTWVAAKSGLPLTGSVRAIVQDRQHPSMLFCAVFGAGVFESLDGGLSWSAFFGQSGLPSLNVHSLALDQGLKTLYAGTERGVAALSDFPELGVDGRTPGAPVRLGVSPNPAARGPAHLQFSLARPENIRLTVYAVSGERVRTLIDGRQDAGLHPIDWDLHDGRGASVPSGIYFLRLETAEASSFARLVVLSR